MQRVVVYGLAIASSLALLTGCHKAARPAPPPEGPHLGPSWYVVRAAKLGIDVEAAKARDLALPEDRPPATLDEQTRGEGAALWSSLCSSCHGMDGKLTGAPVQNPAPRKFGTFGMKMGFTMGGDKMRAGIYRKIRDGGGTIDGKPSAMTGFGSQLSREQLWALVAQIETL